MKSTWSLPLVFIVFFILSFNLASSQPLYNGQKYKFIQSGDCINLPQLDYNATFENITGIIRPDNNIDSQGSLMDHVGPLYNLTYCGADTVGTYTVNGCSDYDCWTYTFDANLTGSERGISTFLILAIGAVLLFILGYYIENEYVLTISGLLFGVAGVYTFIYGFNAVSNVYTQGVGIVLIGLSIYLVIASIYTAIQDNYDEEGESFSDEED